MIITFELSILNNPVSHYWIWERDKNERLEICEAYNHVAVDVKIEECVIYLKEKSGYTCMESHR